MPPKTSRIKRIYAKAVRIALLAAVFMVMAGIGGYLALTFIIKGADTVIVPQLVGKDVLYGLEILSDLGLNTRVKGTVFDDRVPKNHVIDQDPEPGASIKRGRDVKIRVSRGPETITMPNLTGLSLQHGKILVTENDLCLGALARMDTYGHTVNQIIAQTPSPGGTIARKTCVDLLISQGPPPRTFPMVDLTGFTLESAIGRLEQMQLVVGNIRVVRRFDRPLETIVDQTPPAGHRVSRDSRVDLSVNRSEIEDPDTPLGEREAVALFRFHLENGFLKKRVQVKLSQARITVTLFDDFLTPGQEVWLLAPKNDNPTLLVYVDGQLVQTHFMDD